jgi:DNA-binding LacI/PurR family transcriptional regulator
VIGHTTSAPDPPIQVEVERRAPVSIRDVARAAGVSYQTVSRVINGSLKVKESTRYEVLETIARLDYRPNRAARALAGGPVQSVTVLVSSTRLYGPAAALEGIEESSRAAGLAMGVRVIEPGTPESVRAMVERTIEPAGALILIAYDRPAIDALNAVPTGVPMAAIVETPSGDEALGKPWVWIDDRRSAHDATQYLLGLGHRTVHYVSIPLWTENSSQRMAGWRSALDEGGAAVPEPLIGSWGPESGYEAGQKMAWDPDVTAVLCGNDDLAMGLSRAVNEAGRRIPADLSVVGIDDIPLAPFYNPPLTTVRQDFKLLGQMCFARLASVLDGTSWDAPSFLRTELVVRGSAAPPPLSRSRRAPRKKTERAVDGATTRSHVPHGPARKMRSPPEPRGGV